MALLFAPPSSQPLGGKGAAPISKPLPVAQAHLALVPYLLEVSSPVNWHGPEGYELKDKNGNRSGTLLRRRGGNFLPIPGSRMPGGTHRA